MKVAILDDYQSVAADLADWNSLPADTDVTFFSDHLADEDALAARLADFDVIMGMRERTPFPRSLLERLPALRCLITTGGRNASFDLNAATDLGITVCGAPGAGEGPTELTWGLILGILRQIPQEDRATREQASGASTSARVCKARRWLCSAWDTSAPWWPASATPSICASLPGARTSRRNGRPSAAQPWVDKDTLFAQGDVVSVHVQLSDRTRGLVGAHEIGLMKPSAILVNISRGPIVDEAALVDALQRKAIGGAALDTFDVEPLPAGHPFLTLDNTLITPHVGYVTDDGYRAFYAGVVENIRAFASGEPVRVINPDVLTASNLRGPAA